MNVLLALDAGRAAVGVLVLVYLFAVVVVADDLIRYRRGNRDPSETR